MREKVESVKQLRREENNSVRDCYTFDILHVNHIINNMHQLLDSRPQNFS